MKSILFLWPYIYFYPVGVRDAAGKAVRFLWACVKSHSCTANRMALYKGSKLCWRSGSQIPGLG